MKTIAIIGRPNVGKSTLFNRLAGKRSAITDDIPGVTRDRKIIIANVGGIKFKLIDTAGLERAENGSLQQLMMEQTEIAAQEADILFLVVDGAAGITAEDQFFAKWARKLSKDVILLVNKCERKDSSIQEFYRLGFGEPIAISAEHKLGFADLISAIIKYDDSSALTEEDKNIVQISIVGRPNVGKSTIINKIIKQKRVITSPVAGTTRDAINIDWEFNDQRLRLIDTAGLRKKANIAHRLEKFSVGDTLNAIKFSQVAVVVMDATECFEHQDLKIIEHVVNEGRAIIIVLNKWDMVKDKKTMSAEVDYLVNKHLGAITGVTILKISAQKDKNIDAILQRALDAYKIWSSRISTSQLNKWLDNVLNEHSPPISKGRRVKIRYITQIKSKPPSFMLDVSQPNALPESYLTFFIRRLRDTFNLPGTPIRILMPKKENPYA